MSTTCSFADENSNNQPGSGDGTNDGKVIALTLENASISDGQTDVQINPVIELDFNKNICNPIVLANNKLCFHLTEEGGGSVAIYLIFPDDQVQQDYKHQVFIIPKENLAPNSSYRVSVDKTIQAKNGSFIDNAHVITFTTGSSEGSSSNTVLDALGNNIVKYETSYSETGDSIPVESGVLDDPSEDNGANADSVAPIVAIIIAIILIGSIILFIIKRRKGHIS